MYFQGRQVCQFFFFFFYSPEMVSTLKGKNLLPFGSKFFPFRVDLFSEGMMCRTAKRESYCVACDLMFRPVCVDI